MSCARVPLGGVAGQLCLSRIPQRLIDDRPVLTPPGSASSVRNFLGKSFRGEKLNQGLKTRSRERIRSRRIAPGRGSGPPGSAHENGPLVAAMSPFSGRVKNRPTMWRRGGGQELPHSRPSRRRQR